MLAEPVLGRSGIILVLVAAVFSTASAILATIFATGRLANRIAADGQLPHQLTDRLSGGTPVYFISLITVMSIVIQFFGNLHEITTFSSLVFLFVFSTVNYMGHRHRIFDGWKRILPILGCIGCFAAFVVLLYDTYMTDPYALYLVGIFTGFLVVLRLIYTWVHSKYKGRDTS